MDDGCTALPSTTGKKVALAACISRRINAEAVKPPFAGLGFSDPSFEICALGAVPDKGVAVGFKTLTPFRFIEKSPTIVEPLAFSGKDAATTEPVNVALAPLPL